MRAPHLIRTEGPPVDRDRFSSAVPPSPIPRRGSNHEDLYISGFPDGAVEPFVVRATYGHDSVTLLGAFGQEEMAREPSKGWARIGTPRGLPNVRRFTGGKRPPGGPATPRALPLMGTRPLCVSTRPSASLLVLQGGEEGKNLGRRGRHGDGALCIRPERIVPPSRSCQGVRVD
jgi:hypothetical protein